MSRAPAGSTVLWPRGDRATELGTALRDAGLVVTEPVVYASRALAIATAPRADAIFFASPSACSAWLAAGVPGDAPTLAIAIGETTFDALTAQEPTFARISLLEAPSVLGWQRWREIDAQYSMGLIAGVLKQGMQAGELREHTVEPLAHLLLGALGEAGRPPRQRHRRRDPRR